MRVGPILPISVGSHFSCHEPGDILTDALCRSLDFAVADMGIAQRHARVTVAQQTGHNRQRNALHDGVGRDRMAKRVQANILDSAPLGGPSRGKLRALEARRAWTVPGRTTRMPPPSAAGNGSAVPSV